MEEEGKALDRASVEAAIAEYLLQVNYGGYAPDAHKVLAVRATDRTAWLRNAERRTRWEVYYFVEGELFPQAGDTQLPEGVSPSEHAKKLVEAIWESLSVWNGYDFTTTSFGLDRNNYLRNGREEDDGIVGIAYAPV
ncbi:MAG: hypothetical protein LBU06_11655 [Desulfovibrio sp.]|nr:hypothetical protein [Desulfovibrio sp.]